MDLKSQAYEQNYLQFRSLNQIMWQIPVLAMTLTGGLWFGVSRIQENPLLISALLLTAIVGNLSLVAVLYRFRHVMGCYLKWLKTAEPAGYVDASPNQNSESRFERFCNQDKTVRNLFSFLLYWAAGCSVVLLVGYWYDRSSENGMTSSKTAIEYYNSHAEALADGYEGVAFESAYPFLVAELTQQPLLIVDIGAGTGRDAAWMAEQGHDVLAVEPSVAMRKLAEQLHTAQNIQWLDGQLPELVNPQIVGVQADLVLVSAVWMHLSHEERLPALRRILQILKPGRSAVVTLRLGPQDSSRGMYPVSPSEFVASAEEAGFAVTSEGDFADILARPEISWQAFRITKPN